MLAVVTISLSIVGTRWIQDVQVGQDKWAEGESHIHAIYNVAAIQFLTIVDATSGIPDHLLGPPMNP